MRESWQERFAGTPAVLKSAQRSQTVVPVLDFGIGGDDFVTMAGPCSVESEFQLMVTALHVRRRGARVLRGGAFKPRSSPYSFQGLGIEGLKLLAAARRETGLAIVTEAMSECDVPLVAEYADISADRLAEHGKLFAAGGGGAVRTAGAAKARHGGHGGRFSAGRAGSAGKRQPSGDSLRTRHTHV